MSAFEFIFVERNSAKGEPYIVIWIFQELSWVGKVDGEVLFGERGSGWNCAGCGSCVAGREEQKGVRL
jgi:hypothetical protein